ncbi:hypothetical protein [Agarivorans sp.]|uniref:hypothetical protein n=1 Tax=Agarivorans sp. TaxID=1872412 RepID=UPI003D01D553
MLPLLPLLLVFLVVMLLVLYRREGHEQLWLRLPTLEEYRQASSQPAEQPLNCKYCHSEQTWEYGLESVMDYRRECACLACGKRLWRTEQASMPVS